MLFYRVLAVSILFLSFEGGAAAQALFHKPAEVLGDPYFVGTAASPTAIADNGPNVVEGRELSSPLGIALDTSVSPPIVYIADAGNNRVLGYQYTTQMTPGSIADVVIGQTNRFNNLTSVQNGRPNSGLNVPTGIAVDAAGNLFVVDSGNNRILRFPKPFAPGASGFPDLVIGQTTFTGRTANAGGLSATSISTASATRSGIAFDSSGNLWFADTGNNRVLRYPASALKPGAAGPAADLVLGQADFVSSATAGSRSSKTGLAGPRAVAFDPSGRLLVTDGGSISRVIVYAAPFASSAAASRILGVDTTPGATPTTAIQVNQPFAAIGTPTGVVVADSLNNRLLVFQTVDNWPLESLQFSPMATAVVGQGSFTTAKPNQGNGDASATSLSIPVDLAASATELFVADAQNNRVLVFALGPAGVAPSATRVIGQLDFPYTAPNLIEGKEFNVMGFGTAILDQSATPPRLYVADTFNNRILGFSDFTRLKNGHAADLVIGQPDLKRSLINYPSNDATMPTASSLHSPTALAADSAGNLYVADTGNARILRFPAPFASGKTAGESADLVIGQSNFTSIVTDPSASTLNTPQGLALTADAASVAMANSGWMVVSDTATNRVLLYQKPFTNGMSATKVLGAPDFVNPGGGSALQRFVAPRGVAVDPQDRVMVADAGNHRVQIFNSAANIGNFDTPSISLTAGIGQPVAIAANANGFWVADISQNALTHFPTVDLLGIRNNASDAVQPAFGPSSAFIDTFGNVLAADGANRILYFTPEVKLVSSANYSSRALTAGSITSVYPATPAAGMPAAPLASGTAGFGSVMPVPTTLSDTQVLVNGSAAPLFFVSPGQINLVLPNGLSSGGSADVIVTRQSTGQIYGAGEIQLASADPALFTSSSTGSGQVAAINFTDGSVNSPQSPVQRGGYVTLYGTGVGPVANAPPDGQLPSGALPAPQLPQISLGPASATSTFLPSANITYSGLSPGLVGVWQINLQIPADAPTGSSVPIRVFQNSIGNVDLNAATTATTANTTISIK